VTELSAEAYVRGGNKYEEEAEALLDDQDQEQKKNSLLI